MFIKGNVVCNGCKDRGTECTCCSGGNKDYDQPDYNGCPDYWACKYKAKDTGSKFCSYCDEEGKSN